MILFKYILKNHLAPFLFSIFTLFSVLLIQYLMKMADMLVGKGLSAWVITKVIVFSLSFMVVLVIPMAVLVTTLMAFGNMSQNNEIAILKSAGISLYKIMLPPFLMSVLLAFLLVQFNNYVYPNNNHELRILLQDINQTKPMLALEPGIFSQEVQSYSILARKIDQNTNMIKDVTIYDYSSPQTINIVTARSGKIYFSQDRKKLILDLNDGEIHESSRTDQKVYRKILFERHKIAMNADQFSFEQSTPGGARGDRELGAQDMLIIVDSLKNINLKFENELQSKVVQYILEDSKSGIVTSKSKVMDLKFTFLRVEEKIKAARNVINSTVQRISDTDKRIGSYWVEIHKKYALPVACIIFVLIGAPLGTMIRKGGLGIASGVSIFFFVIYWAFLIGGEKLADRGIISAFWGMWSANIVLGILGIWLTIKSAKERVTLSFDFLQKLVPKQWRYSAQNN